VLRPDGECGAPKQVRYILCVQVRFERRLLIEWLGAAFPFANERSTTEINKEADNIEDKLPEAGVNVFVASKVAFSVEVLLAGRIRTLPLHSTSALGKKLQLSMSTHRRFAFQ